MFKKILIALLVIILLTIAYAMSKSQKSIWFEGSQEINSTIDEVKSSIHNTGDYFLGIISRMPSMSNVELLEQGDDYVIIKTNEGKMTRSNILIKMEGTKIILEYDEEYDAGKTVTTNAHFLDEFEVLNNKVIHNIVISELKAPGLMGFLYKSFGSSSMGKAFLEANKTFLED